MRRFLFAIATVGVPACALIADLPDYVQKPAELIPNGGRDAATSSDGGDEVVDGGDPIGDGSGPVPDASADASDKPSVVDLDCTTPNNGLVAQWRLDEGTGTKAVDCSGRALEGTLQNGTVWNPLGSGRIGNYSLHFTGASFVDFGNPSVMAFTGAMSISAWAKFDSFGSPGRILSRGGGPGNRGWDLNVENDAKAVFHIAINGTDSIEAASAAPLTLGGWYHIVGVFEPGVAVRLYVQGIKVGEVTAGVPATQRVSTGLPFMGKRSDCCALMGDLDDIRLYDRVLTQDQITRLSKQ